MRYAVSITLAIIAATVSTVALAGFEQTGRASWYGHELAGRRTATGEPFDPNGISAAHRTLPLNSYAEVTSLDNGRTILVRINDRGPYHGDRVLDLSLGAARQLGLTGQGARLVHIRAVTPSERDRMLLMRGLAAGDRPAMSSRRVGELRSAGAWTAPAAPQRSLASGQGPFWALIASFRSLRRAQDMAHALGATIAERDGIYRVRRGPFADAQSANTALAQLAASGYPDATIVR